MKTEKELVEAGKKTVAVSNPANLLQLAVEKNLDVDKLEKLMELQERWDKNQAKKAFDKAMADFQAKCPTIKKQKGGAPANGKIAYYYAPLESIVEQVKDLIHESEFSYLIKTETTQSGVKVACVVKHKLGHSETSEMEVPLGGKTAVMSAPQVVAAATTFAKRYAFQNAFGILTGDGDIDGQVDKLGNGAKQTQTVKFPQGGAKPRIKAEKPKNARETAPVSVFKAGGKSVPRKKYINVICEYATKNGIDVSDTVAELDINLDFLDMEDDQVLMVGREIARRVKEAK